MSKTHRHHIIPRHAGGTDNADNIVELTIPQHAEAHQRLYEQHGRLGDKLAWLCLSGRSKDSEAESIRIQLATVGFQIFLKSPESELWRKNISVTLTGKTQTSETKHKRSQSLRRAYHDHPELREAKRALGLKHSVAHRERMTDDRKDDMSIKRKESQLWHDAVRSPEKRHKQSINSPRNKPVIVDGTTYHSVREAARLSGHTLNKLNYHLRLQTDTDFVRFA